MDQGSLSGQEMPSAAPPPLRIGLVGCGYQGKSLTTAATRTTTVSVVACADPDARAAEKVAELVPGRKHSPVRRSSLRRGYCGRNLRRHAPPPLVPRTRWRPFGCTSTYWRKSQSD